MLEKYVKSLEQKYEVMKSNQNYNNQNIFEDVPNICSIDMLCS